MPHTASTPRRPQGRSVVLDSVPAADQRAELIEQRAELIEQRSEPAVETRYERIDMDRYAVIDGTVVGFVDVVSPVFVCYLGGVFAKAVEIAQVYDFHAAVDVVLAAVSTKAERSA